MESPRMVIVIIPSYTLRQGNKSKLGKTKHNTITKKPTTTPTPLSPVSLVLV